MLIRIKARKSVATDGAITKIGKSPGRSADRASSAGLIKIEMVMKMGWMPISFTLVVVGDQKAKAISAMPNNQPLSLS